MEDLIKREDAIAILEDLQSKHLQFCLVPFRIAIEKVQAIPSADIDLSEYSDKLWKNAYERGKADRPQGDWLKFGLGRGTRILFCTNCERRIEVPLSQGDSNYDFCPNCGARMLAKDTNVPNKKGADNE